MGLFKRNPGSKFDTALMASRIALQMPAMNGRTEEEKLERILTDIHREATAMKRAGHEEEARRRLDAARDPSGGGSSEMWNRILDHVASEL